MEKSFWHRYVCFHIIFLLTCIYFQSGFGQDLNADSTVLLTESGVPVHHFDVYPVGTDMDFLYQRPNLTAFLFNSYHDIKDYTRNSLRVKNLPNIAAMAAMTGILIVYDKQLLDASQDFGKQIGVSGETHMKSLFHVFGFPVQVPADFSSGLYFIGDGFTHSTITLSILSYGLIKNDTRALQTASQLVEGLVTITFTTQLLKHITGRESPLVSTQPTGRWDFFPDQVEYHKKVPHYDAFPSGHLGSAMMVVTVIAENYKEKKFIRPLGYGLMTILSWQMMNNGVHWASDYPLALAMGYSLGKLAVSRGRIVRTHDQNGGHGISSMELAPFISPRSQVGMSLVFNLK